jgi:hypothetical protein
VITKADFLDWKSQPVTKRVFAEIEAFIEAGKEELSYVAGENPLLDSKRVGKLDGLRSLLAISFYDLEDENVN